MCQGDTTRAAQTEEPIAVDSETTSDYYEDSLASETTSLRSSIFNFQYENGRRYHRTDSRSVMPNDEREQDRLDMNHFLIYLLLGEKHTLAPIEEPHRILDVGTGTGIWALEMARDHPQAEVIGTDITPIQPQFTYPNCRFEIDDLEETWTWPRDHFDLIHSRNLAQSIKDWSRYAQQMFDHTAPGGYVEITEYHTDEIKSDDGTLPEDSYAKQYFRLMSEALRRIGNPQLTGNDYVKLLKETGFTDIHWYVKKQPWGPWPRDKELKKIGRVCMAVTEEGLASYGLALFTRVLGMNEAKVQEILDGTWANIKNPKIHMYNEMDVVVARKPEH